MKPKPRDPWVQRWLDRTTPAAADNTRAPSGKPVPRAPSMGRKVLDFLQQHVLTDPAAPGPLDASVRSMVALGVPPRAARAVADFGMGATEPLGPAKAFKMPKRWAVLSPENPFGEKASEAINAPRREAFEKLLKERGIKYTKTTGGYFDEPKQQQIDDEVSYILHDVHPLTAEKLGRQFEQNSVVTPKGLHDLVNNQLVPSKGMTEGTPSAYTRLPDGTSFALDLDWDNPKPINPNPEPKRPGFSADSIASVGGRTISRVSAREVGSAFGGTPTTKAIYDTPNGKVNVLFSKGKKPGEVYIGWVGKGDTPFYHPDGPDIGAGTMRAVLRDVKDMSGAKKVRADRISGARPDREIERVVGDSVASAGARALRSKAPITPGNAPAVVTRPVWTPQSRGVFDRSMPDEQGTVAVDPRLTIPEPTSRMSASPLVEALVGSRSLRKRMRGDAERGLSMGGPQWYNRGPLRAFIESTPGAMPLDHWTLQGAATSPNNSVVNEISGATVGNFGRLRGLDRDAAMREFLRITGSPIKPSLMDSHYTGGADAVREGVILPTDLFSDAWKVPGYYSGRAGGGGLQIGRPGWFPALDTHEKRMMWQAIMDSPTLTKEAKRLGIWDAVMGQAAKAKQDPHLPIRNSIDYGLLGEEYINLAKQLDLPTAQAGQASRWLGGAERTGVATGLGDYTQLLEDQLLYTAQQLGLPDDPASLRGLMQEVVRGNAFLLPHYRKGPLPLKPQSRSPFAFGGIGKP